MPISQSDFERAEDYVTGRLSAIEKTRFETEVASNTELADEVARLKAMQVGLRRLSYRDELIARHAELLARGDIKPIKVASGRVFPFGKERSLWQYMVVAASVIVVLGLGWFFFLNPSTSSPAEIASQFMEPTLRLDPDTQTGEPLLTSPGPEQVAQQQAITRDTTAIRTALIFLQQHEPTQAVPLLESARNCSLPDWQANARYLLALGYLQTEQVEKAKIELNGLLKTTYYGKQAERLLAELSRNRH